VHLRNLLKGELTDNVAKFGVALSGELTGIDEVVRGKTKPSLSLLRWRIDSKKRFGERASLRAHRGDLQARVTAD
jgi:hypothetical protein